MPASERTRRPRTPTSRSTTRYQPRQASFFGGGQEFGFFNGSNKTSISRSAQKIALFSDPLLGHDSSPEGIYSRLGPLSSAWASVYPKLNASRKSLERAAAKLKAAPETERATIFDEHVAKAQRELYADSNAFLNTVVPPLYDLVFAERENRDFNSGMGTMLEPYQDEVDRVSREVEILKRVFSEKTAQAVDKKYELEVKPLPGGGCMTAMYKGFEVLYSPSESKALLRKVYRDAKREERRTGIDTNHVDRIMETLRSQGRAGSRKSSRYDRRAKTWKPSVESHVMGMIDVSIPGWFFFGLSLSGAYHTVTLVVDTTGAAARIFWLDQHTRGLTDDVTGKLDTAMKQFKPPYGYTTTKVWPIIPDPSASVVLSKPASTSSAPEPKRRLGAGDSRPL